MKIFITGTFRSGTTLATHILNQNSKMSVTYDSVHFMRFAYMKFGKNEIVREGALKLLDSMNKRMVTRFGRGVDEEEFKAGVAEMPRITYAGLYDLFMRLYVGNTNWGEKTVLQWRNAADILEMFDDIHIVHCLRDPRDILSSWKNETIAPGVDYLDAIANCYDAMKHAKLNEKRFPGRYHNLKYEDLVLEPEKISRSLCEGLGLEFEASMLDVDQFKNKVTDEKWEPNTAFGDKIEGISKSPIQRWVKHLPEEDLVLCELVNGELMTHFGYTLSGKLDNLGIREVFAPLSKAQQSALVWNGILNIIQNDEGVQRNPLNDQDPSTWEVDTVKL